MSGRTITGKAIRINRKKFRMSLETEDLVRWPDTKIIYKTKASERTSVNRAYDIVIIK